MQNNNKTKRIHVSWKLKKLFSLQNILFFTILLFIFFYSNRCLSEHVVDNSEFFGFHRRHEVVPIQCFLWKSKLVDLYKKSL